MRSTIYDLGFTMWRRASRSVLDYGGALSLFMRLIQSGRGLPQSKTLARHAKLPSLRGLSVLLTVGTTSLVWLLATGASGETLLLTGGTVHTVSGETLAPGQVLIKDGKIEGVGKTVAGDGAKVVDLTGQHLYPGMIALNTELGLVEIEAVRATRDLKEAGEYTPDVESWIAVNPDSELIPVARANGIAYVEPVPEGGTVAGQSALVVLEGWTPEQMAIKKPVALHVYWPNPELNTTPKEQARDKSKWKSLSDQNKDRREKLKALEDFFEEARAYAKARAGAKDPTAFVKVPSWEAMLPVVRGDIPVMVHADEIRQIRAAVHWAGTNHFKMILAGARDAWMAADLLAANKIPVVYAHIYTQPVHDSEAYDVHYRAPAVLHRAGVTVALTTGGATLVKNLPYHAAQAVAFGLPETEAIKGITLYPAQLIGVGDRLGSIERGKEATLFAADGDILDIRANVKRMWIAGKEVSLENRHTRLYEKYRNRPKMQ